MEPSTLLPPPAGVSLLCTLNPTTWQFLQREGSLALSAAVQHSILGFFRLQSFTVTKIVMWYTQPSATTVTEIEVDPTASPVTLTLASLTFTLATEGSLLTA